MFSNIQPQSFTFFYVSVGCNISCTNFFIIESVIIFKINCHFIHLDYDCARQSRCYVIPPFHHACPKHFFSFSAQLIGMTLGKDIIQYKKSVIGNILL